MTSFLHIASRVEAAVEAYVSVRDLVDREEWKARFKAEMKNTSREFHRVARENGGKRPPLHPTLVGLSIVLTRDEDLGRISRLHPDRRVHEFYDAEAEFPTDISDLLLPAADRWWERLANAARGERAAQTTSSAPPPLQQRKLRFVFNTAPPRPEGESGDVEMAATEEAGDSQGGRRPKVPKGATATRKRKGSSAAQRGAAKRRAQSRQRPDAAKESSGGSNADPDEQGSGEEPLIRCRRCIEADVACALPPLGPCQRCKDRKLGCSMMPSNPETGKTDRRALTKDQIREFRLKQAKELRAEVKRGKRRARDSPDTGEREDSALALTPSPLTGPGGLGALTLDSGGSSANTPADSPAIASQPSLPERPAPAPPSVPDTYGPPKPSAGVVIEAPPGSKLPEATHRQASSSRGDKSPASNDGSNAARISELERKQAELERRQDKLETWLHEINGKVAKLGG